MRKLPQWITNFDFLRWLFTQKNVWWAQINVRDPDPLSGLIKIFLNRSGSLKELWQCALWTLSLAVRVVAKSVGSENSDFTSMGALLYRPEKRKTVFANLWSGWALSQSRSRYSWHCPFLNYNNLSFQINHVGTRFFINTVLKKKIIKKLI
jgi:hypothetical protein